MKYDFTAEYGPTTGRLGAAYRAQTGVAGRINIR
jgi:hypothetical protein